MQSMKIQYEHNHEILEGYVAFNPQFQARRPGVLVAHDWSGRNEFAEEKALQLAELGYVGFALDMFGKGKIGKTNEEKSALIKPFIDNRQKMQERMQAALKEMKKLDMVDQQRIGVIGFCFGGMCTLDLVRTGADITGAVSFHGLLNPPGNIVVDTIKAKVLVLHGYEDPMVPPDVVDAFQKEMTKAKADWQMNIYGNTKHAFMNPAAHDMDLGLIYNNLTEQRAWLAMKNFFAEVFK